MESQGRQAMLVGEESPSVSRLVHVSVSHNGCDWVSLPLSLCFSVPLHLPLSVSFHAHFSVSTNTAPPPQAVSKQASSAVMCISAFYVIKQICREKRTCRPASGYHGRVVQWPIIRWVNYRHLSVSIKEGWRNNTVASPVGHIKSSPLQDFMCSMIFPLLPTIPFNISCGFIVKGIATRGLQYEMLTPKMKLKDSLHQLVSSFIGLTPVLPGSKGHTADVLSTWCFSDFTTILTTKIFMSPLGTNFIIMV